MIELVADLGLGKSRLAEEVIARCPELRVRRLRCEPYEQSTPYFPVRHLLEAVLGTGGLSKDEAILALDQAVAEHAPDLVAWVPLLARVLDLEVPDTPETAALEEQFYRERANEAVDLLLGALITERTILLFEDVHWADSSSGALLHRIERAVADRPWLVICTRRPEGDWSASVGNTTVIELQPLDAAATGDLISAVSGDLDPHQIAHIVERANGSPLFAEALVQSLSLSVGADSDNLPDSVEEVLAAELDSLAPSDRRLVHSAAVLGSSVELDLLETVAPETGALVDARILAARLGGLLVAEGDRRLRFRHQLLCDVAYEQLPFRERRAIHARASEALASLVGDDDDRLGVLSLHQWHAQLHLECWKSSRAAGKRARRKGASGEAMELYQRAVSAARHLGARLRPADVADAWISLGETATEAGAVEQARTALRQARRRVDRNSADFAQLCGKEARLAIQMDRHVTAERWLRRGLDAIAGNETRGVRAQRALLLYLLASIHQDRARHTLAIERSQEAIAVARRARDPEILATAYLVLDRSLLALGRGDDAIYAPKAFALIDRIKSATLRAVVLNNLGAQLHRRGDLDAARDLYEQAREANERAGNVMDTGNQMFNIAEIHLDKGELDQAEPLLHEAQRLWRGMGFTLGLVWVDGLLGRLALGRGDTAEAERLLSSAVERLHANGLGLHAAMFEPALESCRSQFAS